MGDGTSVACHQGTITVWDDLLERRIPLEGVMVRVRKNMFDCAEVKTDANGNFRCETYYDTPCDLSIIWNGGLYKILSGKSGQAELIGPKDRGGLRWDVNITSAHGMQLHYATVHRAAHRYFFGDTGGLGNIPFMRQPLQISVHNDWGTDRSFQAWPPSFPKIMIYRKGSKNGSDYSTWQIFSNASHELGHAHHYAKMKTFLGNDIFDVEFTIFEGWASFTDWHLTHLEYQQLGADAVWLREWREMSPESRQYWPYIGSGSSYISSIREYSPIFIDMVDDFDQSSRNFTHENGTIVRYLNDPISGYTVAQISALLPYMRGKDTPGMRPQYDIIFTLKANRPPGVTPEQIDQYFAPYYHVYWVRQWINVIF